MATNSIRIPAFLQEAFGESQPSIALASMFGFGLIGTLALVAFRAEALSGLAFWRAALALVVVFDIFAGCVANFTRGTNDYYAARPLARRIFIAIHVHLVVLALLLEAPFLPLVIVWAYTIAGATIVNALKGQSLQTFVGGTLLAMGLLAVPLAGFSAFVTVVAQLFMLKVLFAFAVDHYATDPSSEELGR